MKPQRKNLGAENKDNLLVAPAGGRWGCTFLYIRPRGKNTENHLKPP